eukprot:CAMPEP_0206451480 /NCGR_PEP_ID=MMETSP0324_2-20121206/19366_1 /ASSEMBLY_ACC=CAM_ASM_000836 /TAXON_ID=2866 /ORGANISM="Crypthecodinium cohnii, Strain Seligo" /LENGTH=222 /DNA_ID=CAMNT_0053921369 /DNA_START=278 /DNA_END=943 /DNA_ORIENTATION=+
MVRFPKKRWDFAQKYREAQLNGSQHILISCQQLLISLHFHLSRAAVLVLVQAPSAEGDHRVGLGGWHLALAPDAELRAHRAAQDSINNRGLDVGVTTAAELFELVGEESLVHLVDATAAAQAVLDPEGVVHYLALLEDAIRELGLAQRATELHVAQGAGWGISCRGHGAVLGDAKTHLHLMAETIVGHDIGRGHRGSKAQLLRFGRDERVRKRTEAPSLAAA